MQVWKKIKIKFTVVLDFIFLITYIVATVLAILDAFGGISWVESDKWTKISVMIFCTVGMVVLSDKRKLEKNISPYLTQIDKLLKDNYLLAKDTKKASENILNKFNDDLDIKFFTNKTQCYIYLTGLLLQTPNGSRIDVTSFEKNYNIAYDSGEDVHIKAFMKTWTDLVKSGHLIVRQLIHITSPQDYKELNERLEKFKDNYNFAASAIVGLPIEPFVDYMIINQEYIFMGFSNDSSSPNNFSFGFVVKSKEAALNFQNYFNIYWSSQFSTIIKDKDEINVKNLYNIGEYVFDIAHNESLIKYHQLSLEIYRINEHNKTIIPMLENLHRLYKNVCCDVIQFDIEKKLSDCVTLMNKKMRNYVDFDRSQAAELIAKMMFNAETKIIAVSLDIEGSAFWTDEEGEAVFQANVDAIARRNVEIQRVFVSKKDKRRELQEIINIQIDAGIDVYYTEYKKGIEGIFEDFLIIDNNALFLLSDSAVRISIYQQHVNNYRKKFERIISMGSKCNKI